MSLSVRIVSLCFYFAAVSLHNAGGASNNYIVGRNNYEGLRKCLLSERVQSSSIIGRDVADETEEYLDLNWQWSTLYGYIAPLVYLEARTSQDVASAVRCSIETGVRVVAKGGGHSYLKHGFGDVNSFIVDLKEMNDVSVSTDKSTGQAVATIGPGTRQGKIQAELWAHGGWILPVGGCPTVGFAGFVLGGGFGFYARWLGLAADHLLEVTMIDAKGEILTVNIDTDPELFWALRGGGGGNFGIVTSMKLRLRRAPNHVTAIRVGYTWDQFPVWFKSWQTWIAKEPKAHLAGIPMFDTNGITMVIQSTNGTEEEVQNIVNTEFPPSDRDAIVTTLEYTEFVVQRALPYWPSSEPKPLTHISQLVNLTRHNGPGWKRVKSIFVDKEVTSDDEIGKLHAMILEYLSEYSELFFEHQGGAISLMEPSETAYVHRGKVLYGTQPLVFASDGEEPVEAVEIMERFFEETKAIWNHTASYQNYMDQELPDYLQRFYGSNLERLVAVKARVDPDNVFHHSKSIPVSLH